MGEGLGTFNPALVRPPSRAWPRPHAGGARGPSVRIDMIGRRIVILFSSPAAGSSAFIMVSLCRCTQLSGTYLSHPSSPGPAVCATAARSPVALFLAVFDGGWLPRVPEPSAGRPGWAADPDTPGFRVQSWGPRGPLLLLSASWSLVDWAGWVETPFTCVPSWDGRLGGRWQPKRWSRCWRHPGELWRRVKLFACVS